ncbi:MAG TPA: hypothetical protein VFC61_09015 [Blastocatellia bacterium]|nr:hypothetical protein [Blastocatellia bacterium]
MGKETTLHDTPLDKLLRTYADADEIVFERAAGAEAEAAAELCRGARRRAECLRRRFGGRRAAEVASTYGVEVTSAEWETAGGRVVHLAECSLRPPRILINAAAIKTCAGAAREMSWGHEVQWFSEGEITEIATAHELFHVLDRQPSSAVAEFAAHAFARAFTGLPFSPLLYHELLRVRSVR